MIYGLRGVYEPFFMIWSNGEALPENIMRNVVQFSYEDHEDKLDELKFTVLDPKLELQNAPSLQKGAKVLCLWGYVGGTTQSRTCTIEEVEYTLPENGVPQIVVKALDAGAALVKRKARACFSGRTGAQILEEIAKKHQLKTKIFIPDDFAAEFTAQGGKSDFDFMKEIAAERGCSAWVENDVLMAGPFALSEASHTFAYRKDIISLRAKLSGAQGQGERENTEVAGMEPAQKQSVQEGSQNNSQTEGSAGGEADEEIEVNLG